MAPPGPAPPEPYRRRTRLRQHLPFWMIDLGIAAKGRDCEAAGGRHQWYNQGPDSACYHCRATSAFALWRPETAALMADLEDIFVSWLGQESLEEAGAEMASVDPATQRRFADALAFGMVLAEAGDAIVCGIVNRSGGYGARTASEAAIVIGHLQRLYLAALANQALSPRT